MSQFQSVEATLLRGKRDRDRESVQTLSERRSLPVYLEQKSWIGSSRKMRSSEKDDLRLRQKWTWEIGNKEILILLSMKPKNSNLKDWSCIRRIRLKEKNELMWRIGNEKQQLPRKVKRKIAKKQRNYKEPVPKKEMVQRDCQEIEELRRICCEENKFEQHKQELMNCLCNRRGILRLWVRWWLDFGIYNTK